MDRITLHRPAADNAGLFRDAGDTLTVGEAVTANVITEERAGALVESFGAVEGEPAPLPPLDLVPPLQPDDHEG